MFITIIQIVLLIITFSQIGSALQEQQSISACEVEITSRMDKSGTIISRNYPNQYPANLRSSYRFRSQDDERHSASLNSETILDKDK
ncbi:hypothetical protein T11_14819 [Trichinella zimbabwensis]|uniref:Secreted protein n=1 Tax=Trichinella zimbabwensis TaxID=268475 RepID=A0A0V1H1D0_9BILA|nr:hypothetical protein T11_14819 [Trichinella zimbabwensis]